MFNIHPKNPTMFAPFCLGTDDEQALTGGITTKHLDGVGDGLVFPLMTEDTLFI